MVVAHKWHTKSPAMLELYWSFVETRLIKANQWQRCRAKLSISFNESCWIATLTVNRHGRNPS